VAMVSAGVGLLDEGQDRSNQPAAQSITRHAAAGSLMPAQGTWRARLTSS
jgi:hypothetical protein